MYLKSYVSYIEEQINPKPATPNFSDIWKHLDPDETRRLTQIQVVLHSDNMFTNLWATLKHFRKLRQPEVKHTTIYLAGYGLTI